MPALQIEPELIAPRDWKEHYKQVARRLAARPVACKQQKVEQSADTGNQIADQPTVEEPSPPQIVPLVFEIPLTAGQKILQEVAAEHDVSYHDLRGRGGISRKRKMAAARRAAVVRLRTETDLNLSAIGRLLGTDHTSVLHAWRMHLAGVGIYANNGGRRDRGSQTL